MPRITEERRESRRAEIVAAARRCFSRDGFHQTSMPDIAAEAGLSAGASYRYFASKEDIILEIAGQAVTIMFGSLADLAEHGRPPTVADLVVTALTPISGQVVLDDAGRPVPVDDLLRCGVQAWGELLRHDELRRRAAVGFEHVQAQMATALRRGQEAGAVAAELDPERGTRVVLALVQGYFLQRTAFGLDDTEGFLQDVRAILDGFGTPASDARSND